jgi:hypothetical protein
MQRTLRRAGQPDDCRRLPAIAGRYPLGIELWQGGYRLSAVVQILRALYNL